MLEQRGSGEEGGLGMRVRALGEQRLEPLVDGLDHTDSAGGKVLEPAGKHGVGRDQCAARSLGVLALVLVAVLVVVLVVAAPCHRLIAPGE